MNNDNKTKRQKEEEEEEEHVKPCQEDLPALLLN